MANAWQDFTETDGYKSLSQPDKAEAASYFFDKQIAPSVPRDELQPAKDYFLNKVGFEPTAPQQGLEQGDFYRGMASAAKQMPQLAYGVEALTGAAGESVFGKGGISTSLKRGGLAGYTEWGDKVASSSKKTDSFQYSWDKAKDGDLGSLVDFLQYALGYTAVQGATALTGSGLGAIIGKAALKGTVDKIAKGMVAKEVIKLTGSEAGKGLTKHELEKAATANVAAKIGRNGVIAAQAYGMEGGEIGGDAVSKASKEGRDLTGGEYAKIIGATIAAGSLEFVGDKFGVDMVLGKSKYLPKDAGRMKRGATGAALAAPVEGGTEFSQTLIEEYGKGNDPTSDASLNQAVDAAALGVIGGTALGGVAANNNQSGIDPNEETGSLYDESTGQQQLNEADRSTPKVPEAYHDLQAQVDAVKAGRKPAMLVTHGSEHPLDTDGLIATELPDYGTLYSAEKIKRGKLNRMPVLNRDGSLNGQVLGYSTNAKPTGSIDVTTMGFDANGNIVHAEIGGGEGAIRAAQAVAGDDGSVEVIATDEALQLRADRRQADLESFNQPHLGATSADDFLVREARLKRKQQEIEQEQNKKDQAQIDAATQFIQKIDAAVSGGYEPSQEEAAQYEQAKVILGHLPTNPQHALPGPAVQGEIVDQAPQARQPQHALSSPDMSGVFANRPDGSTFELTQFEADKLNEHNQKVKRASDQVAVTPDGTAFVLNQEQADYIDAYRAENPQHPPIEDGSSAIHGRTDTSAIQVSPTTDRLITAGERVKKQPVAPKSQPAQSIKPITTNTQGMVLNSSGSMFDRNKPELFSTELEAMARVGNDPKYTAVPQGDKFAVQKVANAQDRPAPQQQPPVQPQTPQRKQKTSSPSADLITFVRNLGGVRTATGSTYAGEFQQLNDDYHGIGRAKSPNDADEVARAAQEAGYISEATPEALHQALLQGKDAVFTPAETQARTEREQAALERKQRKADKGDNNLLDQFLNGKGGTANSPIEDSNADLARVDKIINGFTAMRDEEAAKVYKDNKNKITHGNAETDRGEGAPGRVTRTIGDLNEKHRQQRIKQLDKRIEMANKLRDKVEAGASLDSILGDDIAFNENDIAAINKAEKHISHTGEKVAAPTTTDDITEEYKFLIDISRYRNNSSMTRQQALAKANGDSKPRRFKNLGQVVKRIEAIKKELRAGKSQPLAGDFVPAPNGSLDYGEITADIAKEINREAGTIRLQYGNKETGLVHIRNGHIGEIKGAGFDSVESFVYSVTSSFDEVRKGSKGALLLVSRSDKKSSNVFVKLKPDNDGSFYIIETGFMRLNPQLEGFEKLWSRRYNRETEPDNQSSFAENSPNKDGGNIARAKSHSHSSDNIATTTKKVNPDSAPINDFGEKIGGARKDLYALYSDKVQHAEGLDIATVPLSKSFPEPNYQKLLDSGISKVAISQARALRDTVMDKPRGRYVRSLMPRYLREVETHRSAAVSILKMATLMPEQSIDALSLKYGLDAGHLAELYAAVGHEKSLKGLRFHRAHYLNYEGENNVDAWTVERTGTTPAFGVGSRRVVHGKDKAEVIKKFQAWYALQNKVPTGAKRAKFKIYRMRATGLYRIGKDVGSSQYFYKEEFKDGKVAREYLNEHYAEIEKHFEAWKEIPSHRRDANNERIGEDHRNGQDVTSEQFSDTFGFRGVEFGNWVSKVGERQGHLNRSYDALFDLATLLNIPTQAISLNGELGLAFGSRGRKGAAAHYERDKVVINLTRKNGAGSLAHEWWHALDNYISRNRKDSDGFLSEKAYSVQNDTTRPELIDAFKKLRIAINKTGLHERSSNLDKRRTKDYWGTGREMSARSFESYVIKKLGDHGYSNDYLANIVSEESFGMEDSYPYIKPSEIDYITSGFDNLFNSIKTKETDQGTALYSKGDSIKGLTTTQAEQSLIEQLGNGIKRAIRRGKVVILDNGFELPAVFSSQLMETRYNRYNELRAMLDDYSNRGKNHKTLIDNQDEEYAILRSTIKDAVSVLERMGFSFTYLGHGEDLFNISGLYDQRTGKIYIVANRNTESSLVGTLLHEVKHRFDDSAKGKAILAKSIKQIRMAEKLEKGGKGSLSDWINEAKDAIPSDTPAKYYYQELFAYAVTQYETAKQMPTSIMGIVKRYLSALGGFVRAHMLKAGINVKLTPATLAHFAASEVRGMGKREVSPTGEGVYGSKQAGTFYSQMRKVLVDKLPGKSSPAQFKQMIQAFARKGQFKQEELEWSGVEDWLDTQEGKITKQQVLDFMAANEIQVEEVEKGISKPITDWTTDGDGIWRSKIADFHIEKSDYSDNYLIYTKEHGGSHLSTSGSLQEAMNDASNFIAEQNGDDVATRTRFANFQLPNGKNYRELLLKLPQKMLYYERPASGKIYDPFANILSAIMNGTEDIGGLVDAPENGFYREEPAFTSPHYDEPNILAHIRFNEREVDGKKVLFIEEVQSDWHQDGRKEGYVRPLTHSEQSEFDSLSSEIQDIYAANGGAKAVIIGSKKGSATPNIKEAAKKIAVLRVRLNELTEISGKRDGGMSTGAVPNSPFKTTWPILAMKRMIRYASEHDFDSIAWTTGEQQAERYDLSKKISAVHYSGTNLKAYDHDGNTVISQTGVLERDLPDHIGKDAAERLISAPKRGTLRSIEGEDLKVGGEGMAAFYDKMLPSSVNKYVKKWGARVSGATIDTQGYEAGDTQAVHSLDITDKMRIGAMQGQPLFSKAQVKKQAKQAVEAVKEEGALTEFARLMYFSPTQTVRDLGVPAAKKIADLAYKDASHENRVIDDLDMVQREQERQGYFFSKLDKLMNNLPRKYRNKKVQTMIVDALNGDNVAVSVLKKADAFKDLLDELHDYMTEAGIDVGRLEHYFPRVYDISYLRKHRDEFIALVDKQGMDGRQVYLNIVENDGLYQNYSAHHIELDENNKIIKKAGRSYEQRTGNTRKGSYEKSRVIDVPYSDLKHFLVREIKPVLGRHIRSVVKRAEYARAYGAENEKLEALAAEFVEQYDKLPNSKKTRKMSDAIEAINYLADRMQGKQEGSDESLRRLSRVWRNFSVMNHLGMVLLASIPETLMPYAKIGSTASFAKHMAKASVEALREGVAAVLEVTTGDRVIPRSEMRVLTDRLGVTTQEGMEHVFEQRLGGVSSKMTNLFMKATMLEPLTNLQRMVAFGMAQDHIARLSKKVGKAKGKNRAQFVMELKDYGLDPSGVNDSFSIEMAAQRFAQQVITTPVGATLPRVMTHPLGQVVFQFKSFTAVYSNTFLKKLLMDVARYPRMRDKLRPLMPIIAMTAVAFAVQLFREAWKYDDREDAYLNEKDMWQRVLAAFDRTGMTGDLTAYLNMAMPYRYGFGDWGRRLFNLGGPLAGDAARALNVVTANDVPERASKTIVESTPVLNVMPGVRMDAKRGIASGLQNLGL